MSVIDEFKRDDEIRVSLIDTIESSLLETRSSLITREVDSDSSSFLAFIFEGGSLFDGFLLAASQEVGQVILTLPYTFSLLGMGSGIALEIFFATLALYTNYLLSPFATTTAPA